MINSCDEMPRKAMSRQAAFFAKKRADGICARCNNRVHEKSASFCEYHAYYVNDNRKRIRLSKQLCVSDFIGPINQVERKARNFKTPKGSDLFWGKIEVKNQDECWEWRACRDRRGYGQIRINKKIHFAHRIAYFTANGISDQSLCVCHKCDNPPCCNPAHLFLGTNKDNAIDMVRKNRSVSCLKCEDVKKIRALHTPYGKANPVKAIAKEFGVRESTIYSVISRGSFGCI